MTTLSLVTGGSRGLGRNTAISIARHGGDVILTYHSGKDNAEAVVAEIEALGRKAMALQLDTGNVSTFPAFADALRGALNCQSARERGPGSAPKRGPPTRRRSGGCRWRA